MMQIKGKSASFRGLTLLLALMLGAGLALTGCGDDDAPATPAPAPAPSPPPQPPAPEPPGTPANLRVASTGVDYIEFSWDMVEGATGYVVQMSMTEGDFSSALQAQVTNTMHKFTVAADTAGYGRVRAMNDDGMSDWSDAVMGKSMVAPLMLGTPMPTVSSTGPDHIEWSWDPVENALAYQVRVADSMAGLADAEADLQTATMKRVDAEPEMEMYISVRAGAGTLTSPIVGDWSAPVRGMSDVAPMPFVVSMMPPEAAADRACSGQPMCPDSQTDPTKAMAGVNEKMIVNSSHDAQVSPMWIDDSGAASVAMGDSTPFMHVSWNAMQSAVANDGVTFKFQRVTTGAGQEPMAMGDMMYITCGPFECTEAADEVPAAPEITIANSAACTAFEAELTLNVGIGFNGGGSAGGEEIEFAGLANVDAYEVVGAQNETKRGIDAGWTYTSTSTASVVHEFVGLVGADGGSMKVTGSSLSKTSTPRALTMARPTPAAQRHVNYFGGTSSDANQAGFGPIWNGRDDCFSTSAPDEDDWDSVGYSYDNLSGSVGQAGTLQRPNQCFRITTAGRPSRTENVSTRQNFLPGYRVHVTPNASVTWAHSSVNWPKGQDPFDRPDLKCGGVTFDAVDQTDVCGSYQQQVMDYWGTGVGHKSSHRFTFEYIVTTDANETVDTSTAANVTAVNTNRRLRKINIVPNRNVGTKWQSAGLWRAPNSVWSSLWLMDARKVSDADIGATGTREDEDISGLNLFRGRDGTVADYDLYRPADNSGAYLGAYKSTGGNRDSRLDSGVADTPQGWRPLVRVELIDSDDDPVQGDFGKVDFHTSGTGRGKADNFANTNSDAYACSSADNGSVTDANGGNGACDATASFEETITFTLYQDTNDCTQSIDIDFTCTWDADGDDDRYGDGPGVASAFGTGNVRNFVTCTQN